MKALKTPLRYPGGKSRACTKLDQFIPDLANYKEYREPFLGGGSVAIHITKKYPHLDIWVNDFYEPLVTFWKVLQSDGTRLYKRLQELKSKYPSPALLKICSCSRKNILLKQTKNLCGLLQHSMWSISAPSVVLLRIIFFSKQASDNNFSMRGIEKLPGYTQIIKNWKITNLSYEELLTDSDSTFTYLDPPYDIGSNLYGRKGSMHKSFDHDVFASDCARSTGAQLISYNASQLVKDRFKEYKTGEFDLTYTMRSVGEYMREQQDRKELLLLNY